MISVKCAYDFVDFHSHILPRADHGSDSLETTLKQLEFAKRSGIKRIIATPHFYPNSHTVEEFIKRRNSAYSLLMSAKTDEMPEVKLGAEVLICNGLENLPVLDKLFINGTNTLLLELPFAQFREEYGDCVYTLKRNGVRVIMAHADRYPSEHVEKMIYNGAELQINAYSLQKPRRLKRWLEQGLVAAVGSDIHGADKKAYPAFVKAMKKISAFAEEIKQKSDEIWNNAKHI